MLCSEIQRPWRIDSVEIMLGFVHSFQQLLLFLNTKQLAMKIIEIKYAAAPTGFFFFFLGLLGFWGRIDFFCFHQSCQSMPTPLFLANQSRQSKCLDFLFSITQVEKIPVLNLAVVTCRDENEDGFK